MKWLVVFVIEQKVSYQSLSKLTHVFYALFSFGSAADKSTVEWRMDRKYSSFNVNYRRQKGDGMYTGRKIGAC